MADPAVKSLPFVHPGVLMQCSECKEWMLDVHAESEEEGLVGHGVCAKWASVNDPPPTPVVVEEVEEEEVEEAVTEAEGALVADGEAAGGEAAEAAEAEEAEGEASGEAAEGEAEGEES